MRSLHILGLIGLVLITSACESKRSKCEKLAQKLNHATGGLLTLYEQQNQDKETFVDTCVRDPAMTDDVLKCFLDADGIFAVTACTLQMRKAGRMSQDSSEIRSENAKVSSVVASVGVFQPTACRVRLSKSSSSPTGGIYSRRLFPSHR